MRSRYILCYDIRDDSRLRRTAKVAERWGNRLQYSVFVCDLTAVERARLESELRAVVDTTIDMTFMIEIGAPGRSSERRFHWVTPRIALPDPSNPTIV
ncbi:MAG TPA: CRISPR-associated endonuclease Cas2 [Gaiellaceae bacterium]|jgi:CRISPR-associated protein Cas2|nr:CRISPR-associated endonuclease Cas2 [Gaiellaceae bacterium]